MVKVCLRVPTTGKKQHTEIGDLTRCFVAAAMRTELELYTDHFELWVEYLRGTLPDEAKKMLDACTAGTNDTDWFDSVMQVENLKAVDIPAMVLELQKPRWRHMTTEKLIEEIRGGRVFARRQNGDRTSARACT